MSVRDFEYAVEITDNNGNFLQQVDVTAEYSTAASLGNILNHPYDDMLKDDENVRIVRIDYEDGEEVRKEVVKEFNRDEPDANELFMEVLEAVHCSIEPYKDEEGIEGYRIYDEELNEYRGHEGEDVVATSAEMIMDELDAFIEDSFYEDLTDELESYGLVKEGETLPQSLAGLYVHIILLANEELDGEGMKFWDAHEEELDMVDLICNRIDEVDLNSICPIQRPVPELNKPKEVKTHNSNDFFEK